MLLDSFDCQIWAIFHFCTLWAYGWSPALSAVRLWPRHEGVAVGIQLLGKDSLKDHIKSVHEGVKYSCDSCHQTFSHRETVRKHFQSVYEGVRYKCDDCDQSFTFRSSLKEHYQNIHEGIRHKCDSSCDKTFSNVTSLRTHYQSIHEGIKHFCNLRDFSATQKYKLSVHMKKVHNKWKIILFQFIQFST